MPTHFDHLKYYLPDLIQRRILDLGSGRGGFLIDAAKNGAKAIGLEVYQPYIDLSLKQADLAQVEIEVRKGQGEKLPFVSGSFDFINMCEVIEHVVDPIKVLIESQRILASGGLIYISVPNRFGLKDQHFGLYFVNWLPRSWSDYFISIFGQHKDYTGDTGHQRLRDMHYYTFRSARRLFVSLGFQATDLRILKIKRRFPGLIGYLILVVYYCLRPWYFDSFHFLLTKS